MISTIFVVLTKSIFDISEETSLHHYDNIASGSSTNIDYEAIFIRYVPQAVISVVTISLLLFYVKYLSKHSE